MPRSSLHRLALGRERETLRAFWAFCPAKLNGHVEVPDSAIGACASRATGCDSTCIHHNRTLHLVLDPTQCELLTSCAFAAVATGEWLCRGCSLQKITDRLYMARETICYPWHAKVLLALTQLPAGRSAPIIPSSLAGALSGRTFPHPHMHGSCSYLCSCPASLWPRPSTSLPRHQLPSLPTSTFHFKAFSSCPFSISSICPSRRNLL